MRRERVTISFLPSDNDLVNHLQAVKITRNISNYLRDLIRRDMNGSFSSNDIEKLIHKLASSITKDSISSSIISPQNTSPHVNFEDKNLIENLF